MSIDLSRDAVDTRLRSVAALSRSPRLWPPLVDMSPEAVSERLRDCAEISALCRDLAQRA